MSDAPQPPARHDPASRLAISIGWATSWLFLVAILISAYEVVMRYAFNSPSTWIHETTTTLCAVGFALGGAWCMVRREHIRISFLPDALSGWRRRLVEILALSVGIFYLAGLAYGVGLDAWGSVWRFDFQGRWVPEATPGPPNWPLPTIVKVALTVGTVLFLLVCVAQLLRLLAGRPVDEAK
jgi:TRAP-type mannitol/chloroaromatic compound transport system permease small subunit